MFSKKDYNTFEKALSRMLKENFYNFKNEVCGVLAHHAKEWERRLEEEREKPQHNLVVDQETVHQLAAMVTKRMMDIIDRNKTIYETQQAKIKAIQFHGSSSQISIGSQSPRRISRISIASRPLCRSFKNMAELVDNQSGLFKVILGMGFE